MRKLLQHTQITVHHEQFLARQQRIWSPITNRTHASKFAKSLLDAFWKAHPKAFHDERCMMCGKWDHNNGQLKSGIINLIYGM